MGLNRRLPRGLRLPGALEPPWARRRRLRAERGTWALGAAAFGLTATVIATEVARVAARRAASDPDATAFVDVAAAARVGYERASTRENALLNVLASFSLTFAAVRTSTYVIHRRGSLGPVRNILVGGRHVHHFIPGILLAFAAGGWSVLSRDESIDPLLALPFGAGVALTLDESALLLKLDDVYWTEEGIVSVQITLAALALTSATALVVRALRRGDEVLAAAD